MIVLSQFMGGDRPSATSNRYEAVKVLIWRVLWRGRGDHGVSLSIHRRRRRGRGHRW